MFFIFSVLNTRSTFFFLNNKNLILISLASHVNYYFFLDLNLFSIAQILFMFMQYTFFFIDNVTAIQLHFIFRLMGISFNSLQIKNYLFEQVIRKQIYQYCVSILIK
ncbi:hypothetical protein pb186bvf_014327 [Paramecium bursaria]